MSRYPETAGFKGDPSGPGAEAAAYYLPQLNTRRRQVLDGLGEGPKTAEQIGGEIGLHWYLVRPRLSELKALGLVAETGQRGASALGGKCTVYRPTTDAERSRLAALKALTDEKGAADAD